MSDIMEDFVKEITERAIKEQAREFALRFISAGKLSLKEIAEVLGLPLEEVEELAKKKTA